MKYIIFVMLIFQMGCVYKTSPTKQVVEEKEECRVLRENDAPISGKNCYYRNDDIVSVTAISTGYQFEAHVSRVIFLNNEDMEDWKLKQPYKKKEK